MVATCALSSVRNSVSPMYLGKGLLLKPILGKSNGYKIILIFCPRSTSRKIIYYRMPTSYAENTLPSLRSVMISSLGCELIPQSFSTKPFIPYIKLKEKRNIKRKKLIELNSWNSFNCLRPPGQVENFKCGITIFLSPHRFSVKHFYIMDLNTCNLIFYSYDVFSFPIKYPKCEVLPCHTRTIQTNCKWFMQAFSSWFVIGILCYICIYIHI